VLGLSRWVFLSFGQEGPKIDAAYREHQTVKDLLNGMKHMDPISASLKTQMAAETR